MCMVGKLLKSVHFKVANRQLKTAFSVPAYQKSLQQFSFRGSSSPIPELRPELHIVGIKLVRFENACSKSEVSHFLTNWGPKQRFSTTWKRNGNFNGLYFRNEHGMHNQAMRWQLHGVSYIVSKFHELWSTIGLKPERSSYPPSLFCSVPVHRTPRNF